MPDRIGLHRLILQKYDSPVDKKSRPNCPCNRYQF